MPWHTWFVFDLGNVLIRLNYERVLGRISHETGVGRSELIRLMEGPGGYRDMEKGLASFRDFHDLLCEKTAWSGSLETFREIWSDFFDGPVPGIEDVLERVRRQYRVAFLSNSNEVHAELIPRQFGMLFRDDDRFIYSHRQRCAKPDPAIYRRALELLGALPGQVLFTDDLIDNVLAARQIGIRAFHFRESRTLLDELEREGLLPAE